MANSSFCAKAIVALDSAEADLASRQTCNLVFKKVAKQASIFLEFPFPSHGSDEQAIILVYDADMLSSGEQSLKRPGDTVHLQPEEHAAIARNKGSGVVKHLTLTMKERCCRILMPRSVENTKPEPGFVPLYDQIITLAKARRIHILFDYNCVHKKDRRMFMQFVLHPEKLSGHPIDVSSKEKLKEVDPFGPCEDATHGARPLCIDEVPPPTERPTAATTPSAPPYTDAPQYSPTEKATTVATLGTPPPYTKASSRHLEHNHKPQCSPTEIATTVPAPSTQSPCINASKTRIWQGAQSPLLTSPRGGSPFRADVNTVPSPAPRYSPDIHAPILQEIVRNAVESMLAEVMRDVLPDILQCAFEVASPPNANPGHLTSSVKDSLRAILSEEAAAQLEDKVDDVTQNLECYAEDLSAALEEEWRDQVEDVVSSVQRESVSELRKVTEKMIRKIKDTGSRIREDAEDEFAGFNERLKYKEAADNDMGRTPKMTPQKRVGDDSASSPNKRPASIDRLRGEVSKVAHALEGINAVQKIDHQSDAIAYFIEHFAALDEQLQLAVIETFNVEFMAKTFVLLTLKLKKAWVQLQLKRRRDALYSTGVNFDQLMAEIEWNEEGDVTRKVVQQIDLCAGYETFGVDFGVSKVAPQPSLSSA